MDSSNDAAGYRAGMKVGSTERIALLSDEVPEVAAVLPKVVAPDGSAWSCGGAAPEVPFLPDGAGADFVTGRDIFLALSSVTMMSPCC